MISHSEEPTKKSLTTGIDNREWRFVAIVILFVLLVTSLPYLYAYLSSPPDKQFMGIMLDVPDHGQYFSWMRELSDSAFASNMLTSEPNKPVFFNLLWWGLGHVQKWFGLSLDVTYQLFRLSSGFLFLVSGYWIISYFVDEVQQRRTAYLIFTFGSGFGWVLVMLKYTLAKGVLLYPLDVFIAEGNTFLGILGYPHFIAAALYTVVFILFLHALEKSNLRYAIAAGVLALILGWQHAYDLVLVYGVLIAFVVLQAIREKAVPRGSLNAVVTIGLLSFWPALYSVLLTTLDPTWSGVLEQFENAGVFTPNLLHLPILLGPAFLLALAGFVHLQPLRLNGKNNPRLFLLAWFGANFLLIYVPTDFQIHMLNGWQIPIAILSTIFIYHYVLPRMQVRFRRERWVAFVRKPGMVSALILMLVVPTNLYLWSWRFVELSRHEYPFYLHQDEVRSMEWLDLSATSEDVVLSSLTIGQYIPAWTGARAYLAHWAQTLDFFDKRERVDQFFKSGTTSGERQMILADGSIDFLFYGPAERELGMFMPGEAEYLEEAFSSGKVTIFRVVP